MSVDVIPLNPNRGRRGRLTPASSRLSDGALAVLAAVPAWWARRAADAGLSGACLDVAHAVATDAPIDPAALPTAGHRVDVLDATPEQVGDAYVTALDRAVRSDTGRHYTPPLLATALWEQAQATAGGQVDGLVLDPACGAGALLLPPLRSWLSTCNAAQPELVLAGVATAVAGRDLDEAAVWLGNVVLASVLLPWWAQVPPDRRRPLPALLHVGDGLEAHGPRAAAIVMNPPYGRIRLDQQERARWSHAVYGHANRYGLFMAAGATQLRQGGVLAALVPAGWLGGSYFQRLRAHLAAEAPLHRVAYVRERADVFSTGVLQETLLATFVRGEQPRDVRCEAVAVNGHSTRVPIGTARPPAIPDLPWPLPRDASDVPLVRRAASLRARLSDYGWKASTGPLVWNRAKDRISAHPRKGSVEIVWAADLDGGRPRRTRVREPQRWLHLRPGDDRTLVLDHPAVLVQRTTAPEQPRRLVAAELDAACLAQWGGRVVVENHLNVLTCRDPESPLTARLVVALLASAAFDRLYRCLTGSVAVSAYELAAMPLPDHSALRSWALLDGVRLAREIEDYYRAES
ncbi:MAG: Eco57I restriction-modification methylase domain-containing protein [Pseudonocardiaceae bacterium]